MSHVRVQVAMAIATTVSACASAATTSSATSSHATSSSATTGGSVERFVDVLQRNGSLYGVGRGCDEWRAGPDNEHHEHHDGWFHDGRLVATLPDAGRIYGFNYGLQRTSAGFRMAIAGRGSWSPAPGVTFEVPGQPGWFTMGSASYCLVKVDLRPHPEHEDAVLVGRETWYLTREACQSAHSALANTVLSCSDIPK
jgi:hypothetical protein